MKRLMIVASTLLVTVLTLATSTTGEAQSTDENQWETQWGGMTSIYDLEVLTDSEAWAVGSGLHYYNGDFWRAVNPEPYSLGLRAIDLLSQDDGWAVGSGIAAPIENGRLGDAVSIPAMLEDVQLLSPMLGYAVGSSTSSSSEHPHGVIYQWNGAEWRLVVTESMTWSFNGIWMASPTQGWAVGHRGVIMRLDHGEWTSVDSTVSFDLMGIHGRSADDVRVVGGRKISGEGSEQVILHYDGETWSVERSGPYARLLAISMCGDSGWAVGDNSAVLQYRNGIWSVVDVRGDTWPFAAVGCVPDSDDAFAASIAGARVVHLRDGSYRNLHAAYGGLSEFTGLKFFDESDGWAVGRDSPVLRYDGEKWNRVESPGLVRLNDIDGLQADDVWAVGSSGMIFHFDGSAWSRVASSTDINLLRLAISPGGSIWAAGYSNPREPGEPWRGTVIRYADGEWRTVWQAPEQFLDIDVVDDNDVWVISNDAHWRFDGDAWQRVEFGGSSIDMVTSEFGWIGKSGTVYQFDGETWTKEYEFPAGANPNGLELHEDGTGWVAAWYGYVAYRNADGWRLLRGADVPQPSYGVPSGFNEIETVQTDGRTSVWAVGGPDSIYHGIVGELGEPVAPSKTPTALITPPAVATATTGPVEWGIWLPWLRFGR